jgi:hypothetical protein
MFHVGAHDDMDNRGEVGEGGHRHSKPFLDNIGETTAIFREQGRTGCSEDRCYRLKNLQTTNILPELPLLALADAYWTSFSVLMT